MMVRFRLKFLSWLLLGAAVAAHATDFDDCEARIAADPDDSAGYRCFRMVSLMNGDEAEAIRRLRRHVEATPDNLHAPMQLGYLIWTDGTGEGDRLIRDTIERMLAAPDRPAAVGGLRGLASVMRGAGLLEQSAHELERARQLAVAEGDPRLLADVHGSMAWLAIDDDDYGRAWTLFRKVEASLDEQSSLFIRESTLAGLTEASQLSGRFRASLDYLEKLIASFQARGDTYHASEALYRAASISMNLLDSGEIQLERVRELVDRSLQAALDAGNPRAEIGARILVAELTDDLEERHRQLRIAFDQTARRGGGVAARTNVLRAQARNTWQRSGDAERALSLMSRALDEARRRGDLREIAEGRIGKAELLYVLDRSVEAVGELTAALETIERIRDQQRDDDVRAITFSRYIFAYDRLCSLLLDRGREEDVALAFEISERLRARVLLENLDSAKITDRLMPEGELVDRRDEVLDRIVEVQRALIGDELDSVERKGLLDELDELERRERSLRHDIARAFPQFAALRQPELASLDGVQQQMRPDEAMLVFMVATDFDRAALHRADSWLIRVTASDARAYRIDTERFSRRRIQMFSSLVQRRDASAGQAAAALYRDWLAEALGDLPAGIRRLIVIPDGPLHQVPMSALRTSPAEPPLGSRYDLSTVPSATLWHRWRLAKPELGTVPALAIADPLLRSEHRADDYRTGTLAEGMRLGPLPHARREADAVVNLLGGGSRLLQGESASEHNLKGLDLAPFRVVHFATHAVVDDLHPARSAVLLTPGADDQDGLLQVREVVDLELRDKLIVLSACRSATGLEIEGEGVMGMAHAFFQAGARTVVGSLWPLRDDDASALAQEFADRLRQGLSVREAMAGARRELIRAGAPPAAWAGLVVLGDGDLVPMPRRDTRWMWWGALALVLAIGYGAFRTLRR